MQVREDGPDAELNLITPEELHKIRQLWLHEEGDWEDSLPRIYREEMGEDLDWLVDDHAGVGLEEKQILQEVAAAADLPLGMLQELLDTEMKHSGMSRRSGIYDKINTVFEKDWMSYDEALADTENQPGLGK